MRRSFIFYLFCLILVPFLFVSPVKAEDPSVLDQSQTLGGGSTVVYSEYNRNQTFKVTKTILTKIEVLMKNRRGGSTITLTVKDENTGSTIATKSQRMDDGDGWETFDLKGDALGIVVDKTHTFSMWIGTAYYPSPAPSWEYENSDVYANGTMRSGTNPMTGDYAFKTYGWELILWLPPVEDEEPPVVEDQDNEEVVDEKTPEKEVVLTPDTSSSLYSFDEDDVDDTVIAPALEFVIVNNIVVDSQKDGGVVTDGESIVKIAGTADAGDTVTITIGDKIYTTKTDSSGNWYMVISSLDLKNGSYTVKAYATNENKKISSEVELFKLNISEGETVTTTEEEKDSKIDMLGIIIFGVSGLLLIGLIILVIFLIRRNKKGKKSITEVTNSEITKEEPKEIGNNSEVDKI